MSTKTARSPEPVSWMMPSGRTWRVPCVSETHCWSRYEQLLHTANIFPSCSLFKALVFTEDLFLHSHLFFSGFFALKDVESYDPILNPVLNREVRRTGGRVLITLGDQDIDLSPSFVIFLSTRDPTVSRHLGFI